MTRLASLVLVALIVSGPGMAFAAAPPATAQTSAANPGPQTPGPEREYLAYQAPNAGGDSVGWITFRLFSSLVLVGGLMAGGFYVYRRWMMRSPMAHRGELVRVVGRNYLGPKESLVMVKVGKDVLLLGVTSGQISFLQKWGEGSGVDVPGGDGVFSREIESTASRLRTSGVESSIRGHLKTLQEHVAQLRSSVGRAPRA